MGEYVGLVISAANRVNAAFVGRDSVSKKVNGTLVAMGAFERDLFLHANDNPHLPWPLKLCKNAFITFDLDYSRKRKNEDPLIINAEIFAKA